LGEGGNGKSVFSVVVSTVLGDYATTAPLDTFMETKGERHPTDLAGLRGSRLVLCSETAQGRRWAESKIKALTGGDKVSARFMRQDFFEFTPQFKLLVIGNHKPGIRSVDEAIRRRLHLLPFTVTIPKAKQDKKLMEKLLLERDGILAWAVEGCLEWQLKGLAPPPCVVAATEEYFEEEDRIGQFLEEECEQGVNFKVAIADLYTRWKERAEARGEYVGTARWLVGELVDRGFDRKQMPGGAKGLAGLALKNSGPGRRPYAVA
jgi:putative DNA primase/helicase